MRAERDVLDTTVKDLRGRNKGLQRANESLVKDYDLLEDELNECVNTKIDTVRKMRDEINKTLSALCKGDVSEIRRMIDQIAKEMLEGIE